MNEKGVTFDAHCISQSWFGQFWSGNYSLKDSYHSGWPWCINIEFLRIVVEEQPMQTQYELAKQFNRKTSIIKHHALRKESKFGESNKCTDLNMEE